MTRPDSFVFRNADIIKIQPRCALITRFSFVVRRTVRKVEREGREERKEKGKRDRRDGGSVRTLPGNISKGFPGGMTSDGRRGVAQRQTNDPSSVEEGLVSCFALAASFKASCILVHATD